MSNQITVTFHKEFNKDQLAKLAEVLRVHVVYTPEGAYEFVPFEEENKVTNIRMARIEATKKRIAEYEANKPEPKPMSLSNVSPMPVKHKQSFIQRWFSSNPTFDGPGAA